MSDIRIIYHHDESGQCHIVTPSDECIESHGLDWIIAKDVPKDAPQKQIKFSDLPKSRYFRDIWEFHPEKNIHIDMEKAKMFHVEQLRKLRAQKFIDIGFPYKLDQHVENAIVSDEMKDKLKELRDMPQNIDLSKVQSAEELEKIIPDCLK